MDNSLDERMAPALHTSEHERTDVTMKDTYQLKDSTSNLDKKNGLLFSEIDGPFSNTLPENNHHNKNFESKLNSVNKCLKDYNQRGPTGDHQITNLKQSQQLSTDGSGDFKVPRTNGWSNMDHSINESNCFKQPNDSQTQTKSNGTGLHKLDLDTETLLPPSLHLDFNEKSKTFLINSTIPTDTQSATTISTLINSISPSMSCPVISSQTSISMSSFSTKTVEPKSVNNNVGIEEKVLKPCEKDAVQSVKQVNLSSKNQISLPTTVDSHVINFVNGFSDITLSTESKSNKTGPLNTNNTPVQFLKMDTISSTENQQKVANNGLSDTSTGQSSNTAKTILTFNTTSPISSHCEVDTDQKGNISPPLETKTLNVPGFLDLAHGLVSGGHMKNLSANLTNTLQELAASLKSQAAAIENDIKPVKKSPSPEKVLKFDCSISNLKEIEYQHNLQLKELVIRDAKLNFQVAELQKRLNKVRIAGLSRHVKTELTNIAANCQNVNINESFSRNRTLWRNVLCRKSNNKKLQSSRLQKLKEKSFVQKGSTKTGVLKKELHYAKTQIDEDLTDISSDEESVHFVYSSGTRYSVPNEPLKKPNEWQKANSKPKSIDKSAAWKWACDRAEVAKRWTWLQAQVSELEFKIRHHSDLYKQIRASKDKVILGNLPESSVTTNNKAWDVKTEQTSPLSNSSSSPQSNIKQLVKNVEKQTSSFLDTFLPLSGTTSPVPKSNSSPPTSLGSSALIQDPQFVVPSNVTIASAARCRPLRYSLRRRRLVRVSDLPFQNKKPSTISNNSSIMKSQCNQQTPFTRRDGRHLDSLQMMSDTKAATHDHSYHRVLSFDEDVSLSVRMNAFMGSNSKWCKDHSTRRHNISESKFRSKKKELKRKLAKAEKLMRSVSALQRNSSVDSTSSEKRKRRGSAQIGDSNKRSRMMSVDSDIETSSLNRSGSSDMLNNSGNGYTHYQAMLKRKRQADQSYDINNIVIPLGLTATRIEKLQYKEILTPGWRTTDEEPTKKKSLSPLPEYVLEEQKNMTDMAYQIRHDNYEVMEKKKYVAYIQWTMNKKNGARSMGRANLPPQVDAMLASTASSPTFLSPSSPSSPDPYPSASGRTRRSSSDQYNFHVHASISDVGNVSRDQHSRLRERLSSEQHPSVTWECRKFPLSDADYVDLMKEPVLESPKPKFQPIHTHDTNTAPKYKNSRSSDTKSYMIVSRSRDDDHYSDGSTASSTSRRKSSATTRTNSPVTSSLLPRRHKPTATKDDFYYYSDIDTEDDSATSSACSDAMLNSDEERARKTFDHSDRWTSKSLISETYSKSHDSEANVVPPLLLKIKKR